MLQLPGWWDRWKQKEQLKKLSNNVQPEAPEQSRVPIEMFLQARTTTLTFENHRLSGVRVEPVGLTMEKRLDKKQYPYGRPIHIEFTYPEIKYPSKGGEHT